MYFSEDNSALELQNEQYDCSQVVFIFISDVGANEMLEVLTGYKTRESVPQHQLEKVVRSRLDKQWQRLKFGKEIDVVVPFLP